jgi:broad specificity phosphatase PhoE
MSYIDYKTKYHKYKTKYLNFIKQNSAMQIGGEGEIPIAVVCTHGDIIKCLLKELTGVELLKSEIFSPCSIVLLKLRKSETETDLNSSAELKYGNTIIKNIEMVRDKFEWKFNTSSGPLANVEADIYLVNQSSNEEQPWWFNFYGLRDNRNLPLDENGKNLARPAGFELSKFINKQKINVIGVSDLIRTHQTMEIMLQIYFNKENLPNTFYVLPCNYEIEYNKDECDMESDFTLNTGNKPTADEKEQMEKKTEQGYLLDYSEYWKTSGFELMRHRLAKGVNKCAKNKLMMLESIIALLNPTKQTETDTLQTESTTSPIINAYIKFIITSPTKTTVNVVYEKSVSSTIITWENSGGNIEAAKSQLGLFFISDKTGHEKDPYYISPAIANIVTKKNIVYQLRDKNGKILNTSLPVKIEENNIIIDAKKVLFTTPITPIEFQIIAVLE